MHAPAGAASVSPRIGREPGKKGGLSKRAIGIVILPAEWGHTQHQPPTPPPTCHSQMRQQREESTSGEVEKAEEEEGGKEERPVGATQGEGEPYPGVPVLPTASVPSHRRLHWRLAHPSTLSLTHTHLLEHALRETTQDSKTAAQFPNAKKPREAADAGFRTGCP